MLNKLPLLILVIVFPWEAFKIILCFSMSVRLYTLSMLFSIVAAEICIFTNSSLCSESSSTLIFLSFL